MEPSILDKIKDWESKVTVAREMGIEDLPCPNIHNMDGYCFRCGNKGYLIDVKPKYLTDAQKIQVIPIIDLIKELYHGFEKEEDLSLRDIAEFLASRDIRIGNLK